MGYPVGTENSPTLHLSAQKLCGSNRTRSTNKLEVPRIVWIARRLVAKGKLLHFGQGNSGSNIRPQKWDHLNINTNNFLNPKRNTLGTYYTQICKNDLLIGFINVQSLPKTRRGSKNVYLTRLIYNIEFYHTWIAETRRHCPSLQEEESTPQIFRGHFMIQELDSITIYNKHYPFLGPFQYRWTYSLSTGNITGRKTSSGRYLSGIGRWSWQEFRGKDNASTRIATFYTTVPPAQRWGPGFVYSQHLTLFNTKNIRICPRTRFLHNIKEKIDKWKVVGYQIILMGNFNDYILSQISCRFFAKLGLRELISEKHGEEGPGTTIPNKRNNNIDGIWWSPGLSTTSCGYLPVHYTITFDHRLIWVKVSLYSALGNKSLLPKSPSAQILILYHLSGQEKYT